MFRRALLSTALVVGAVSGSVLVPAAAGAATTPHLRGNLGSAVQNPANHSVRVRGYAIDMHHPGREVRVALIGDGKVLGTVTTTLTRTDVNRRWHVSGRHGFAATLRSSTRISRLTLVAYGWNSSTDRRTLNTLTPAQVSPGARVIAEARRFVGVTPYVYGGASPSGFDCSGFVMYVYQHAGLGSLPHSAQAQMTARRVHLISRSNARPGDLIFYLSGGYAYHVAIYAGHGMDYAATQPGERVKYQRIWGSNLRFGTTWH